MKRNPIAGLRPMRTRFVVAAVLALSIAPFSLADEGGHDHGGGAMYDPLSLNAKLYLTKEKGMTEAVEEAEGAIAVPPFDPSATEPTPIKFVFTTPIPFKTKLPFTASVYVRADQPCPVCQDPVSRKSFDVALAQNGKVLEGTLHEVPLANPVVAQGDVIELRTGFTPKETSFAEGDTIEMWVYSYVRAPQPLLSYLTGGAKPSWFQMNSIVVPALADLKLETAGFPAVLMSEYKAGARSFDVEVDHDAVTWPEVRVEAGTVVTLAFHGMEGMEAADTNHGKLAAEAREAAAHKFTVNGKTFATHPGVVVLVPVTVLQNMTLSCTANCPESAATGKLVAVPKVAVPSPGTTPATSPTKAVTEDGGATRSLPAASPLLALAAAGVALASRRLK